MQKIMILTIIIAITIFMIGCKSENTDSTREAISPDLQAI